MGWTADAVFALAPDEASAKAARGLVAPAKWPLLGADASAVWGECQGSGSKPYQTQVDLQGPAFRCSCPSRKFPCKHGLALMLLQVNEAPRFSAGPPPAWVTEWLQSRAEKAGKKEQKSQAAPTPADPAAEAERAGQRWARMAGAGAELQTWLRDQVARGLGTLGPEHRADWHTMAARMVDMQVPGLAQRISEAAEAIGTGARWPERVLRTLAGLQLICDALQRWDALPWPLQADLRIAAGWPVDRADVMSQAAPVRDTWLVLGQVAEERERLTERRVWLQGQQSQRRALLLDHAFAGKGFEQAWLHGHAVDASLAFFPGASGLRALAAELHGSAAPASAPCTQLADEWLLMAERTAACPWTPVHPLLIDGAVFSKSADGWWIEAEGQRLPALVSSDDGWVLLAQCGAQPSQLMGEWDGAAFRPLSAWTADGSWQWGTHA